MPDLILPVGRTPGPSALGMQLGPAAHLGRKDGKEAASCLSEALPVSLLEPLVQPPACHKRSWERLSQAGMKRGGVAWER